MPGHRSASDLFKMPPAQDPGDAKTITVDRSPFSCGLASAAAETRTLARPTREGALCLLYHSVDAGDITLTVTGGFNEDGDTAFTFTDPGQFALFVSVRENTTYEWRKVSDYSTANLTPAEAAFLDGLTAGTLTASKAVVVGAQGQIDTLTFAPAATAQQAVSSGDGSTSVTPKVQVLGTSQATGTLLVGVANTTDGTSGGIAILKSGNAAMGSFTTVASGESLGSILWFGDNGTDYLSPAGKIECLVDTTPGAADMPGRLVFSTTTDGTETPAEAFRIDNAQRLISGAVAAQAVGGNTGSEQFWGTTAAKAQSVFGCASTAAGTSAEVAFARDKGATVGLFTAVASGDVLGAITAYGANGSNYANAHAQIQFTVSTTPGASDAPGAIILKTTPDGSTTLTEAFRVTDQQVVTSLGARPSNVTAAGAGIFGGGIAMTDVLAAWIDDSTHGAGTTSILIGNQTITTSSDSRIKKNLMPFTGALAALKEAPRVVSFEYDHPNWGGDRAAPGDEDARKWGPNARGRYVGFIAQETVNWAPWVVNAGAGKDCPRCRAGEKCDDPTHPIWSVEYQHLVPLLVQAVKELAAKVSRLEKENA